MDLSELVSLEREHLTALTTHVWYPRSCRGEGGRWDSHRPEVLATLLSNEWTRKWYMELLTASQLANLHTYARQRADPNHVPPPDTPLGSPMEITDEYMEEVRVECERRKAEADAREQAELDAWVARDWTLPTHADKASALGL